jgi:sRNA-binding protein
MYTPKPLPNRVIAAARARYHRLLQVRAKLQEQFPKCFQPFGKPKIPLMIGIDKAVLKAAPSIGELHDVLNAIWDYCSGKTYLTAMIEGTPRIDLEGNAVGVVTLRHQLQAEKQLRRMAAKEQREKKGKQLALASAAKPPPQPKPIAKAVIPKTAAKVVVVEVRRRRAPVHS